MSIDATYAQRKLDQCRRFIELCGANFADTQDKIYLRMARDGEQDCVYWQAMVAGNTHEQACKMAYGSVDR
jgi:hypothetical protein